MLYKRIPVGCRAEYAGQFLRIWAIRGAPVTEVAKRMGCRAHRVKSLVQSLMDVRAGLPGNLPTYEALTSFANALGYKITTTLEENNEPRPASPRRSSR